MTVYEILRKVSEEKPVSRTQIYHYFKALKIKPLGARQKPQRFPDDAADKILLHLGFKTEQGGVHRASDRVVSMRTLKAERSKSGGVR